MSRAYYNEIDPFAAEWIRQLIKAGHVAPGDVDERDIRDIKSEDLTGYTQCHFFAGIGAWSHSLRRAGWPDDRPVWTGSCPCQPFSAAGKGKGKEDERHLWPAFFGLIRQSRPSVVFGEQVAAAIGHGWLDLVQSDLEGADYSFGKAILGACSVGAPHIRQRLYFVADSQRWTSERHRYQMGEASAGVQGETYQRKRFRNDAGHGIAIGIVADPDQEQCGRRTDSQLLSYGGATQRHEGYGKPESDIETSVAMGDTDDSGLERWGLSSERSGKLFAGQAGAAGFWADAGWLWCRDNKYRPVEPGTFPLAHGSPNRVGRLRGYGNAVCAEVAKEFISAYMETQETEPAG